MSAAAHPARKPDDMDKYIGERIRHFRRDRDLTQQELADRVGVSYQMIWKYERGHNRVSCGRLFEIACVLDVPIGRFFEGIEDG